MNTFDTFAIYETKAGKHRFVWRLPDQSSIVWKGWEVHSWAPADKSVMLNDLHRQKFEFRPSFPTREIGYTVAMPGKPRPGTCLVCLDTKIRLYPFVDCVAENGSIKMGDGPSIDPVELAKARVLAITEPDYHDSQGAKAYYLQRTAMLEEAWFDDRTGRTKIAPEPPAKNTPSSEPPAKIEPPVKIESQPENCPGCQRPYAQDDPWRHKVGAAFCRTCFEEFVESENEPQSAVWRRQRARQIRDLLREMRQKNNPFSGMDAMICRLVKRG